VKALDIYSDYLRDVNRHADVLTVIERALELDPLSVSLYHDLGRSLTFLGRFDAAQDAFDRISQINPGNPYAAHGAGLAAILSGQLVRAAAYSDRAIQIDPADYENPSTSALIYLSIGDLDMARRRLDEALALGPEEPYPLAADVVYRIQTGADDQALAVARTALASDLEDRWGSERIFLRMVQSQALATEGYDEALAWFRRAVPECLTLEPTVNADNIRKAVDLALLLRRTGAGAQADALLREVIRRYDEMYAPGAANYPLGISKVSALASLGDLEAALATLEMLIDEGWRILWQFELETNRALDPLREDPRFHALFDRIREDLEMQQTARIRGT
jgi:tetratricopeptide (TPR) repeat protein